MKVLIALSALVAASYAYAIHCPDNCDSVPVPNCKGSVLIGFCGCPDTCAKVEYETCIPSSSLQRLGLIQSQGQCDRGLECSSRMNTAGKMGTCMKKEDYVMVSKRMIQCPTDACSQVEFKEVTCDGGKIEGWCGCTQHCAKVRKEECVPNTDYNILSDQPNLNACDTGLVCKTMAEGKSLCVDAKNAETFVSK